MAPCVEASEPRSGEHVPVTPDWTCGSCGEDWPCATKRRNLLIEYQVDRASLSVYLGSCLAAATHDLRAAPVTALQDRFIGWVPRGSRTV
ncbi:MULTISPECIES: hypothetical protein [unclassified Micromonospora]|uniref:hypothetical protein n=1 Tax=unclassified Micromonospora TaxID=2617518 RepID=UPI000D17086C|nr:MULTISPECIES: hypothetical protein [unclassified Micromonospora]PTA45640.1 hypothetical protein C8054_13460 [Micromonospora sp. RP3T]GHJ17662.1 hypothetical protein TPA0908_56570 [Micromonospora sp. AKA38]